MPWGQETKTKQKQYCNKFNKDFKNGPHQKNFKKKKKNIFNNTMNIIGKTLKLDI